MIFKWIICGIVGHEPDPDDDLVRGIMHDERNWMRRCKRCGRYIMHDGVISGLTVTLSERDAKRTAEELRIETKLIHKYAYGTRKEENKP